MPAYPAVMNPDPRLSVGMRGRVCQCQCQIIKHIFLPSSHFSKLAKSKPHGKVAEKALWQLLNNEKWLSLQAEPPSLLPTPAARVARYVPLAYPMALLFKPPYL